MGENAGVFEVCGGASGAEIIDVTDFICFVLIRIMQST